MPRPHEPFADAMRTAREIVETEADALVDAVGKAEAYGAARHALTLRIAQAIVEAGEAARHAATARPAA